MHWAGKSAAPWEKGTMSWHRGGTSCADLMENSREGGRLRSVFRDSSIGGHGIACRREYVCTGRATHTSRMHWGCLVVVRGGHAGGALTLAKPHAWARVAQAGGTMRGALPLAPSQQPLCGCRPCCCGPLCSPLPLHASERSGEIGGEAAGAVNSLPSKERRDGVAATGCVTCAPDSTSAVRYVGKRRSACGEGVGQWLGQVEFGQGRQGEAEGSVG